MKNLQLKIMQWFWFTSDKLMDKHSWFISDNSDPFWTAYSFLEDNTAKALCALVGHRPTSECSKPEHDYCLYCHKSMPGSWERSEK